ncbi:MAG: aspartate kinase [Bacteroidales bacterium]|nr:aspartate kinase [Bacteroidales bacterium]
MFKVFKFGGASVKDAAAIKNLKKILSKPSDERLVIVVSAMGKTTNALEKILEAARNHSSDFTPLFDALKVFHYHICSELFETPPLSLFSQLEDIFQKLYFQLSISPDSIPYDEHYDQTVSFGELLATKIVSHYLIQENLSLKLVDARACLITDNCYRAASINWPQTCDAISTLKEQTTEKMILTQGFIGIANNGRTTTLGREGSDFSAAIFAHCLNASEVVIWKDVPGLLNGDPKRFSVTQKIDHISYSEAIELAFYGATVIHPKTIKPLQNKSIPLKVQSFNDPELSPTLIDNNPDYDNVVPSFIIKDNQMLISISPRDFSFMSESNLQEAFGIFHNLRIHANLIQASAISLSICIDENPDRLEALLKSFRDKYAVKYNSGLEMLTIRHYNEKLAAEASKGREILLEQRSRITLQFVMKTIGETT